MNISKTHSFVRRWRWGLLSLCAILVSLMPRHLVFSVLDIIAALVLIYLQILEIKRDPFSYPSICKFAWELM